ncbi:MAG: integrin [Deltaproteobacteria bacterium]|nr:integrin [Deltaproteobacteria bacterium]
MERLQKDRKTLQLLVNVAALGVVLILSAGCYRSSAVLEGEDGQQDTTADSATLSEAGTETEDTDPPYESIFPIDWETPVYIKASSSQQFFRFGQSISISGNTMVVGSDGDNGLPPASSWSSDEYVTDVGAAYVFSRNESGQWQEDFYLKGGNSDPEDFFGWSVAVDGSIVVVGAPEEDSAATGVNGDGQNNDAPSAGAAYIFERWNGEWQQRAYVKASNAQAGDRFGWSVNIHDERIAISAIGEAGSISGVNSSQHDNNAVEAGAVYIFEKQNEQWTQTAYLKASNVDAYDYFGYALSLEGTRLAVGAHGEQSSAQGIDGDQTNNSMNGAGAVYIFELLNGGWQQTAYIKASNSGAEDGFGSALDFSEDTLVVGAQQEDSSSVGVNENGYNDYATFSGAVYVFQRADSGWTQAAYLKAANTDPYDLFGCDVAVDGHLLAVGAYGESSSAFEIDGAAFDNESESSGAVYLFERLNDGWRQQAYIKAFNNDLEDYFGISLDLSGSILAVGATGEDTPADGITENPPDRQDEHSSGAVYVYSLSTQ